MTTYYALHNSHANFHSLSYSNKHKSKTSDVPDVVLGGLDLRLDQKGPIGEALPANFLSLFMMPGQRAVGTWYAAPSPV